MISSFFSRDQGSACTIFVGLEIEICHTFGIKDQKFEYKNGISDEKTYLFTTLIVNWEIVNIKPKSITKVLQFMQFMSNI